MKIHRSLLKLWLLVIFCVGFLAGSFQSAAAVPQFSFAGYRWEATGNRGAIAQIRYGNPSVPTGLSSEWVMSGDSIHYIQSGWIKVSPASGPIYFVEYSCSTVCRNIYSYVPSNTTHEYKVALVSSNWCAYIDGVQKLCVSTSALGMSNATIAYYSGETSDTDADLGGTQSSHLRLFNLRFKKPSDNLWYQVNTNYMVNILTPGTPYYDSIGYTSPYTWVDNWTQR